MCLLLRLDLQGYLVLGAMDRVPSGFDWFDLGERRRHVEVFRPVFGNAGAVSSSSVCARSA